MRTLLRCGVLVDGTGADPVKDAVIVLNDDRIGAVGGPELLDGGDPVVDLRDRTVVPGLIDLHTHLWSDGDAKRVFDADPNMTIVRATRNLSRTIRSGITTIREAGSPRGLSFTAKAAVAEGIIEGPRMFVSGIPLAMTGGHSWYIAREVDGADDARKAAREQIKRGAEWIKLMATGGVVTPGEELGAPQMTVEEMAAACEEAHKAGRRAMAHAVGSTGIQSALRAGVDTIEHGIFFDDEDIEEMLRRDVYLVPTFSPNWTQSQHGRELGMPPHVIAKATQAAEQMFTCIAAAARAGVKIAMGTDAGGVGVNHSMVAVELELMLKSGACRTPMEVIQSATSRAADALGKSDELGTVQVGKIADLVALDSNPLDDISAFRSVAMVIKDGRPVGDRRSWPIP